jgi:hypothetical protein
MQELANKHNCSREAISQILQNKTYYDPDYTPDPERFKANLHKHHYNRLGTGVLDKEQISQVEQLLLAGEISDFIAAKYKVKRETITSIRVKLNKRLVAQGQPKLPVKRRASGKGANNELVGA